MSETIHEREIVAMPALALRAITVFPHLLLHFDVGREFSIRALEQAMTGNREIFLVTQKDLAAENPAQEHLYQVGTVATIKQILRLPDNNVRVMVEGKQRGKMLQLLTTEPYLTAELELLEEEPAARENTPRTEALIRQIYSMVERYTELSDRVSPELYLKLLASDDPVYIADYTAQNLPLRFEDKQLILEELRPAKRLEKLVRILAREVEIRQVESELEGKVQEQMAENQRDYYMREQLKVLQRELGDRGDGDEIAEYRERVAKAKLPDEVREKLLKEIKHLEKQPYGSAEASVLRGYLDTCLELPWTVRTKERANVAAVSKVLEADHYGMEKVKERILEFVAVKQLSPNLKGQVLCLVGPPGVGKTSIAMSVARAMNRKLARISLGGVHDEAEIRGHRKTYVGAMPGRIIAGIRQAGSVNPVLVLDELDKVGSDHRGDPSAALLEVLDVHQNATFRDHYLEMPFDLSEVLFIATANTTDTIPQPLLDRIDLYVEVPPLDFDQLSRRPEAESSAVIKARVNAARAIQTARFGTEGPDCNAHMGQRELSTFCAQDQAGAALIKGAFDRMGLTARSYDRILRVARTIADLDGAESIAVDHLAEAIQYRESALLRR